MSSSLQVLNQHFKVVSYNGGPINGGNGVANQFHAPIDVTTTPHSSKKGCNFDIVLEYTGPNDVFTLGAVVVKGYDFKLVTAPLKTMVAWVRDDTKVNTYTRQFDNMTAARWVSYAKDTVEPKPATIVTTVPGHRDAIGMVVAGSQISGKFVHLKLTERHFDDINIDFSRIYLLGYAGINQPPTPITTTSFDPSMEDFQAAVATGAAEISLMQGKVNPMIPSIDDVTEHQPVIALIATTSIKDALAASAAGTATSAQSDIVALYKELEVAAANPANKHVAFVTVDTTTDGAVARSILCDAGLDFEHIPDNNSAIESSEDDQDRLKEEAEQERVLGYTVLVPVAPKKPECPVGANGIKLPSGVSAGAMVVGIATSEQEKCVYYNTEAPTVPIAQFITSFATAFEETESVEDALTSGNFDEAMKALESLTLADESKATAVEESKGDSGSSSKAKCKLPLHVCSAPRFPGDKHPLLSGVYVAVPSSFEEIVVESDEPVLLGMYTGDATTIAMIAHTAIVAELLEKYAVPVRVVLLDATVNDLPKDFQGILSTLSLIMKQKPKDKSSNNGKNKNKKSKVEEDTIEGQTVKKNSKGADVVVVDLLPSQDELHDDDDEDEDEDGSEDGAPVASVQLRDLMDKVPSAFTKVAQRRKEIMKDAANLEGPLQGLFFARTTIASLLSHMTFITAARTRNPRPLHPAAESSNTVVESKDSGDAIVYPGVNMTLTNGSDEAKTVAALSTMQGTFTAITAKMPFPFGTLTSALSSPALFNIDEGASSSSASPTSSSIKRSEVQTLSRSLKQITQLEERLEGCLKTVGEFTNALEKARDLYRQITGLLESFPASSQSAIADGSTFLMAYANLARVTAMPLATSTFSGPLLAHVGGLETIRKAVDAAAKGFPTSDSKKVNVARDLMTSQSSKMKTKCAIEAEVLMHTKLGPLCPRANNDIELMRALEGCVDIKAPIQAPGGAKKKGGAAAAAKSKAKKVLVPHANERLILLLVTTPEDGTISKLDELKGLMDTVVSVAEDHNKAIPADDTETKRRYIAFYRAYKNDIPESLQMFVGVTATPVILFVQDTVEAPELRVQGAEYFGDLVQNVEAFDEIDDDEDEDEDEDEDGVLFDEGINDEEDEE